MVTFFNSASDYLPTKKIFVPTYLSILLFQAEGEAAALQRKFTLLQDEHQRSESKLTQTTNDLNEASNKTDEINRAIKTLETKNMIDEESKIAYQTEN